MIFASPTIPSIAFGEELRQSVQNLDSLSKSPSYNKETSKDSCITNDEKDKYKLPLPGIYNFISIQEFDGRKNVTCEWWKEDKLDKTGKLYANKDSIIHIIFDKDKLVIADKESNGFFASGQLSLSAHIGERVIEVQGYSEVGKDRTTVGATGMPPHRFLLNMQQFQYDLMQLNSTYKDKSPEDIEYLYQFMEKTNLLNQLLKDFLQDEATAGAFFKVLKASPTFIKRKSKLLNDLINQYEKELQEANRQDNSDEVKKHIKQLEGERDTKLKELFKKDNEVKHKEEILEHFTIRLSKTQKNIGELDTQKKKFEGEITEFSKNVKEYENKKMELEKQISDIKTSKDKAEKQLEEINKNNINEAEDLNAQKKKFEGEITESSKNIKEYENKKTELEKQISDIKTSKDKAEKQLEEINKNISEINKQMESDISEIDKTKKEINEEKQKLFSIKAEADKINREISSSIPRILDILIKSSKKIYPLILEIDIALNNDFKSIYKDSNSKNDISKYWEEEDDNIKNEHDIKKENGKLTRRHLVYREIFQNLVDGQIVLNKVGAKPGDIVTIDLLIYQHNEKQPLDIAKNVTIVEAINKTDNEKPISFTIAQIHVDDYGHKMSVVDSFLLIKTVSEKSVNNISPSNFKGAPGVSLLWSKNPRPGEDWGWFHNNFTYGINVSYLDFDTTKDVEIGTGPIIGLFGNRVQLGFGFNLNSDGNLSERMYWFIGFSFTNIAGKFNKSDEKK